MQSDLRSVKLYFGRAEIKAETRCVGFTFGFHFGPTYSYLRNIGHGPFVFHTFQREWLFWAQFLSICLKNIIILSAMKMRRAPPSSFLRMRSKLPYWENIGLCVQNDECDSYRYPTDLEIWEDGLGCITEGWKYQYFSYRIYFLYTQHLNIHHHENAEYWWNKAHIENTGIYSPH